MKNCTVYVGNLKYETTIEELKALFGQNDRSIAWVKLVADKHTGKPTGFGFVEFGHHEEAVEAVKEYDGIVFGGRTLKVAMARSREQQQRARGAGQK